MKTRIDIDQVSLFLANFQEVCNSIHHSTALLMKKNDDVNYFWDDKLHDKVSDKLEIIEEKIAAFERKCLQIQEQLGQVIVAYKRYLGD